VITRRAEAQAPLMAAAFDPPWVGAPSRENPDASSAQRRAHAGSGSPVPIYYMRMSIGGSKMGKQTPNPESEKTRDRKPETGDAKTGSAAEQAKEQEREMEESGKENAA
jgi:hypothetical protein